MEVELETEEGGDHLRKSYFRHYIVHNVGYPLAQQIPLRSTFSECQQLHDEEVKSISE